MSYPGRGTGGSGHAVNSSQPSLPRCLQYEERHPRIKPNRRNDLHGYLGGCVKTLDGIPEEIGGSDDHVHLLLGLRATHCLADVLREIKKASSRWAHEDLRLPQFAWQEGYGAFTVSRSSVATVRNYIAKQEEHHRKRSFQEEYLDLLKKHDIKFDERFLW